MATTFAGHGTLSAATVATVTLTATRANLRIQNRGTTDPIYYTFGVGTAATPTVAGDDTYALPPGATDEWTEGVVGLPAQARVVKLISAGTPAYSVEAW